MNTDFLKNNFEQTFKQESTDLFFSPGRINIIGEHTDYNGGHVFPCAISLGTYAAYGPRTDKKIAICSGNMDNDLVAFEIGDRKLEADPDHKWINYFKGMTAYVQDESREIDHGFNLYVWGNLPYGAGLSSSASIEMLIGHVLTEEYGLEIDPVKLAQLGQKTENEFIGLSSGIMDQFAVNMSKKDHAIFLDCASLKHDYLPLDLGDYEIIIMTTNKKHTLADSAYNDRVRECQEATSKLQEKLRIDHLGDIDEETFNEYSYLINEETLLKRARHAVFENQRTIKATKAMADKDLDRLGRLINASHVSLHFDYEVTGKELDTLAGSAWQQDGCLCARMIGGGFGGSAIAIVKEDQAEAFKEKVGKIYQDTIGYAASFYEAKIVDGTHKL
ncbi:galactokinase [Lactobacillus delbrueckii]|uniref:galactokinase n=1 Tax=Lactobacillus delbrueckii TaxID=1584 RepID=UPI00067F99B5|nr:galactokinase [Lactobacillus delbrueckii]APP03435.1 galactokinase [Lactobacillus delbrueckii subsp. indicus]KNE30193.1 galactokinase [Lactobacillus delbrueckii subsp. indicus]KRL77614.1 galactokinase [Lactobacillus delbrueckii subsp. indicus DSM 15996]TXG08365.1 galactokinase [Lactobacillus delbrueckii subsp. bulgaricus]